MGQSLLQWCPIVHFKGEHQEGSLAYVRVFHDAMRIFSGKHFAGGQAFAMRSMIEFGIRARPVSAFLQKGGSAAMPLPLMEAGFSLLLPLCWCGFTSGPVGSAIPGGQRWF